MKLTKTTTKPRRESAEKPAAIATARELTIAAASPAVLLAEVRALILETRQTVAQGVNSALVLLYWQIGQRIHTDILKQKRAEYGDQIFHSLSGKLASEFGRGFTKTNLFNMVRFAEVFPDAKILHALSAKFS